MPMMKTLKSCYCCKGATSTFAISQSVDLTVGENFHAVKNSRFHEMPMNVRIRYGMQNGGERRKVLTRTRSEISSGKRREKNKENRERKMKNKDRRRR